MKANVCEPLRTLSQRRFHWLAGLPDPQPAPQGVLAAVHSEGEAIAVSMRMKPGGPYTDAWYAERLGISRSYLCEIKKGGKPMPRRLRMPFASLTGTTLLQQFEQLQAAMRHVAGRETEADRIDRILRDAGVAIAA